MKFPIHVGKIAIALTSLSACAGEEPVQPGNSIEVTEVEGYADDIDNQFLEANERDYGSEADEQDNILKSY